MPFRRDSGHLILLALLSLATRVDAQPAFGGYDMAGAAYHKFVPVGAPSIQLLVVGSGGSGIYEVGEGTDLGQLLALTGFNLNPGDFRTRRVVTLRLFRPSGGKREVIYEASLEEFLSEPGSYPELANGDVFSVDVAVKSRLVWRDIFTIVGGISSVLVLADRLR